MQHAAGLAEHGHGTRTGKLIDDPDIWFAVNAQIDGVDPHGESPVERLKYAVYQRRYLVDALKTKALLLASLQNERAAEAAKEYFAAVMPTGELAKPVNKAANWGAAAPLPVTPPPAAPAHSFAGPPKPPR
jgi:hypothetical protein